MDAGVYSAALTGSYIRKAAGFAGGTITNSVETSYVHRILNGNREPDNEAEKAAPAVVSTILTKQGSGLGYVSKEIIDPPEEDAEVCEGESVTYQIAIKNDTNSPKSYRIDDPLSSFGLEFYDLVNQEGTTSCTCASAEGSDSFVCDIVIPGNGTAYIRFRTRVRDNHGSFNEDNVYYIVNKAKISVIENDTVKSEAEVVAKRVKQVIKTPELVLEKTVDGEKTTFRKDVPFNYMIMLTNIGGGDSTDTDFTDVIPDGLAVTGDVVVTRDGAVSDDIVYDPNDRTIKNNDGAYFTVPARGGRYIITVPVTPTGPDLPDKIINKAYAHYTPKNPDGTPAERKEVSGDNELVCGDIKTTDIEITKTADYGTVQPDGEVNFTITVENKHPDTNYTDDIVIEEIPSIKNGSLESGRKGLILTKATDDNDNVLTGDEAAPLKPISELQSGEFGIEQIYEDDQLKGHRIVLKGGLGSGEKRHFIMTYTTDVQEGLAIANKAGIVGGKMSLAELSVKPYTFPVIKTAEYSTDEGASWVEVRDGDPIPQGALIKFHLKATNKNKTQMRSYHIADDMLEGNFDSKLITIKNENNTYKLEKRIKATVQLDKIDKNGNTIPLYFDYTDNTVDDEADKDKRNIRDLQMYSTYMTKLTYFNIYVKTDSTEDEVSNMTLGQFKYYPKEEYNKQIMRLDPDESIAATFIVRSDASAEWNGGYNKAISRLGDYTVAGESYISFTAMDELTDKPLEITKTATYRDEFGNLKTIDSTEVGSIPAGNDITFNIKVRNTQTTKSVTAYKIEDEITGNYNKVSNYVTFPLTVKKNGKQVTFEGFNSTSGWTGLENPIQNARFKNGKLTVELCQCNSYGRRATGTEKVQIDQPGDRVVLAPGEEIELEYTVTAAKNGWDGGTNTARVYPGVPKTDNMNGIVYSAPVETSVRYEKVNDVPVLSMKKSIVDVTVNGEKRTGDPSVLLDETAAGEDIIYTYKVRLENNSTEDFNIKKDSYFNDVLPDGLKWYNDGDKDYRSFIFNYIKGDHSKENALTKKGLCDAEGKDIWPNANALWVFKDEDGKEKNKYPRKGFSYDNSRELKIIWNNDYILKSGGYLEFCYQAGIEQTKATELRSKMVSRDDPAYLKDISLKNVVTLDSNGEEFRTEKPGAFTTQISAAAKSDLISEGIHPGIYKEYLGTVTNVGFMENAQPDLDPHTELVWRVVLYNGYDNKGAAMSNYKVADVMPPYSYSTTNWAQALENRPAANKLPAYIKLYNYDTANNQTAAEPSQVWNDFIAPDPETGMISLSDSKYAIPPGGKLEMIIVTKPPQNMSYGMYTNTAYLIPNETDVYQDSSIIAGSKSVYKAPNNTTYNAIQEYDNVSIQAVYSRSVKHVFSNEGSATSFDKAPDNRVMAGQGETVRYVLEVDYSKPEVNDDPNTRMTDLTVIDKLPFEGDMAIGSEGARGSEFEVKYDGNTKVDVKIPVRDASRRAVYDSDGECLYDSYDITDHIKYAYSSQPEIDPSEYKRMRLMGSDTDWLPETLGASDSVYTWVEQPSESMNMIRFSIENLDKFKAENGANPFEFTAENGETHYGLPAGSVVCISFDGKIPGYVEKKDRSNVAWNSFAYSYSTEDYKNMMAEPAKIGVYIDPSEVSAYGNISVRKVFKSNKTANRTFNFALYDGEYEAGKNPLRVKEVTLSGRVDGSQTDTYFDKLPLGKTYYVYESDSSGVPLAAAELTGDGSVVNAEGRYAFTADSLVQQASLTPASPDAKMIFTNTRIIEPEIRLYGPLYADVPTSETMGASANMTSTRPTSFEDFERDGNYYKVKDELRRKSNERDKYEYDKRIDGYGGDMYHNHTIATGFIAEIGGDVDNESIGAVTWTITSTPDDGKHGTVPVYVRLRTSYAAVSNGEVINERAVLMLNDFAVDFEPAPIEERTADAIGDEAFADGAKSSEVSDEIGFGKDEGIETIDDEIFRAQSIEERAVMIAESLGIDTDKILWSDFGEPYVLLDEEVADKAEYVSEDAARLMDLTETEMTNINEDDSPQTTEKNFTSKLVEAGFGDDSRNFDNAYTIFKLTGGPYKWKILDNTLPQMTLSPASSVYVGLIIDQLYDQHAAASISLTGDADADRASVAASKADSPDGSGTLRYTHVKATERFGNN